MNGSSVAAKLRLPKSLELLLGFCVAYVVMILLGLVTMWLGPQIVPGLFSAWAKMTVARKALIALSIDLLWVLPVLILWRKWRLFAVGIILYLAYEVVLMGAILLPAVINS